MRQLFYILILLLLPTSVLAVNLAVRVDGVKGDLKDNVLAFLSVEQERTREGLTPSRLRLLHRKAPDEIRQALQPFGYFDPLIESTLEEEQSRFIATYRIDPGQRTVVEAVDYQVVGDGAGEPRLSKPFPLAVGDKLDLQLYDKAKGARLSEALGLGYLDAHYERHEVRVDKQSHTARIELTLETGQRFRFGEIRMEQDILDPEFLARYLSFQEGDPYSHEQLLDLQSKLIDSEYFKQVEVNSRRDQVEGDRIPVDVQLSPNRKNRYRIGLGYSTDTGPRITLDWKRRRFGREGHRMRTELRLSKPQSSLTSEYIIPLQRPTVDYLSYGATIDSFDQENNQGDRALLNATYSIGLERGWRRTLSLDYLYEDYTAGTQNDTARLLIPGISWTRVKWDGREFTNKGKKLEFHFEGAHDALLSSTSYLQAYTTDKFIFSLNRDWRLLTRVDLGVTLASDLEELPPSKRFYAGGDNSVRGFSFESLGPRDENGEVIGGRYLAVGSLEVERRIKGRWSGALFLDGGNAFDPKYLAAAAYGAGVGLRWRSPVGPIRFDLARGHYLDEVEWRLHVVLGPEL